MTKTGRSFAGLMMVAALCWPAMTIAQTSAQGGKPSITSDSDAECCSGLPDRSADDQDRARSVGGQ